MEALIGLAGIIFVISACIGSWINERSYARKRKKYREAIERGEDPPIPIYTNWRTGAQRINTADLFRSPRVQKQLRELDEWFERNKNEDGHVVISD